MSGFSTISPKILSRLIGTPDCPHLIDVCIPPDFEADPYLIPGSRKVVHDAVSDLAAELGGAPVVVICQKGKKLSAGAAAMLRTCGVDAVHLDGGMVAWRDAGLPRIAAHSIPGTIWVTRHRPKIDRIACPWLIRRFVDPAAKFLFVPGPDVDLVAEKFNATPFDMPGGDWSHDGERCSFDTMLSRFGLDTPALQIMARVIRAADTDRHDLAPEAAGLLALSVGLSRGWKDDLAQLEAAMPLYDALFRWARDGQDERHSWPGPEAQA